MSKQVESERMGKFVKMLLSANLCLWIYFWIAFARASYPYQPNRWGHPSGTGFTFWGHSIALGESGLVYPFFRIVHYTELPSFGLAMFSFRIFDRQLAGEGFFLGISEGGWYLIVTMMASF